MDTSNSLFSPLFEGERVRLAARDPEKDAETESRWTHDPDYLRAVEAQAEIPLTELNLHRLSPNVFEYNQRAICCYEKAGFVTEGRVRQFFQRDGRRWDFTYMGILR